MNYCRENINLGGLYRMIGKQNMIRLIVLIIFVSVCTVLLQGCTLNKKDPNQDDKRQPLTVVLRSSNIAPQSIYGWVNNIVRDFEKKYPDYKINIVKTDPTLSLDEYSTQLESRLEFLDSDVVLNNFALIPAHANKGYLEPLDTMVGQWDDW